MISGQSLTCPKGASLTFEIDMDTGSDLTGATAQWALCESWFDQAKVYLTKTGAGDGLFIGQDAGVWKITVNLAPTDTLDIPSGLLYHDCKVLLQSGDVEDVANGPFGLDPSVNILDTNAPITRNLHAVQLLGRLGQNAPLTVAWLARNLLATQSLLGLGQSAAGTVASAVSPVFQADFTALTSLPSWLSLSRATTGTYFDSSGVMQIAAINAPRFDHAWNGSAWIATGILIEEQRTNLLKDSGDQTTANWGKGFCSVSTSATTGADNSNFMKLVTANSGSGIKAEFFNNAAIAITSGANHALSIDVKKMNWNYIWVAFQSDTSGHWVCIVVDLSTNAVTQTGVGGNSGTLVGTPTVTILRNGIVRVAFIAAQSTATGYLTSGFAGAATGNTMSSGGGDIAVTLAGTETLLIDATQISPGSTPTSYIPTTSAAVTRSADIPSSNSPLTGYLAAGPSVWEFQDEATGTIARSAYAAGAFDWPVNKWYRSVDVYPSGTDTSPYMTIGSVADHFVQDGATYPFYGDATTPCAAYDISSDKTWIVWEAWNGTSRVVEVVTYSHSSGTWSSTYTAGTNTLTGDDHGAPSICRDGSGYWHIFYGSHNSILRHAVTNNPDDPSAWTEQAGIDSSLTYPHPTLIGSTIYLFTRFMLTATDRPLSLFVSSSIINGVVTWGTGITVADFGDDSRFYQGPHILRSGKIHIVATRANNADTIRQDVYYLVYDPSTGAVSNLDGSVSTAAGSLPIGRTVLDTSYRILVQPTPTAHANIPHVCYDTAGDLHLLYIDEPTTGDLGVFHRIYSAGAWNTAVRIGTLPAKDTAFLIVPNGTGVEAYWSAKQGKRFLNGGDLMKAVRPSGGPWGSSAILRSATAYPLGEPTPVLNGVANARVIFSETNDTVANPTGTLRGFLYGDSGYVHRRWASAFVPPVTWAVSDFLNPVDYSADLLTTKSNGSGFVLQRATGYITSGNKKYFELVVPVAVAPADTGVGVATGNQDLSQYLGQSNEGVGMYGSGLVYINSAQVATLATFVATNNIGIAVDRVNNKIWWRVNGGNWNNAAIGSQNPATNTGGQDISAISGNLFPAFHVEHSQDNCSGKFAAASWTYTAPSGFSEIVGV